MRSQLNKNVGVRGYFSFFLPIIRLIEYVKMQISNKFGIGLSLLFCWLRKPEVCVWVR